MAQHGAEGSPDEGSQRISRLNVPSANQSYRTNYSRRTSQAPSSTRTTAPGSRKVNPPRPRNNQRPAYSLAGNTAFQNHGIHVDPRYHELNPNYQKEKGQPLWGLAKPLPRVIRAGMTRKNRNGEVVEDKAAEINEPGSSEAIPQVGMIDDQRAEAGLEAKTSKGCQGTEDRGYGHQNEHRAKQIPRSGTLQTLNENPAGSMSIDQYGSPSEEKGDPMNEWSARHENTQESGPFTDAGDIGTKELRRLSSVKEESASNLTLSNVTRPPFGKENSDEDLDLEVGDQDEDWSIQDEEERRLMEERNDHHNQWASIRAKFREPLAECLATLIAVLIGLCTNLSVTTSSQTAGTYFSQNWGWGLGITIGIYVAGGISGGHLNPAISLTLSLYRGFPPRKACIYIAAQVLGAFLAGLIAFGLYHDAILSYDNLGGGSNSSSAVSLDAGNTALAITTQPESFVRPATAFFNEFVATAILSCAVLALGDDSNAPPGAGMHAFIVGLLVTALTMAFGYNTGACLNPARDLGPRAAAAVVGYGRGVWTQDGVWWVWGAWGATIAGALVGGLLYDGAVFVGGESPVNYPRGRRKRAERKARERVWWRWRDLRRGVRGEKARMERKEKGEGDR